MRHLADKLSAGAPWVTVTLLGGIAFVLTIGGGRSTGLVVGGPREVVEAVGAEDDDRLSRTILSVPAIPAVTTRPPIWVEPSSTVTGRPPTPTGGLASEGPLVADAETGAELAIERPLGTPVKTPRELPSTTPSPATSRGPTTTTRTTGTRQITTAGTGPTTTGSAEAVTSERRPPSIPLDEPATTTTTTTVRGGELSGRFYGGWCRSTVPSASAPRGGPVVRVEVGSSIQAAIDDLDRGVVELATGVHEIDSPLRLRSDVVLRGESRDAVLTTTAAMQHMVELGGGYTGPVAATVVEGRARSATITTSNPIGPGLWLIGGTSGGQTVRVLRTEGNRATLELPLTEDLSGSGIAPQRDPITRSGLERVTIRPRHTVQDLVVIRSALDTWVRGITTEGTGGQVRSGIFLRQAYRVGVLDNEIIGARELGDGGQGYGINIANNTSNSVVSGNRLRLLRHSIVLHAGATGNVIARNDSGDARHPNFVEGGPADLSFHGYAPANLVMNNRVERIQISDAGRPGPGSVLVGNVLRIGPLTLDNGVDQLTLLGNSMEGTLEGLRSRVMPSIRAESTAGSPSPPRPYWARSYDPFGRAGDTHNRHRFGDGILDWGAGNDIVVDPGVTMIDPCNLP